MNIHDQRIMVTMVLAPIQLSMWLTGSIQTPESSVFRLAVVTHSQVTRLDAVDNVDTG